MVCGARRGQGLQTLLLRALLPHSSDGSSPSAACGGEGPYTVLVRRATTYISTYLAQRLSPLSGRHASEALAFPSLRQCGPAAIQITL